jgi:hypothetical protein
MVRVFGCKAGRKQVIRFGNNGGLVVIVGFWVFG